jgi:hypothetical protein
MRLATFAFLALAGVSSAAAQASQQPSIMLTIFAGAGTGHGLWVVEKQPLQVLGTSQYDTLRLVQEITPSIIVGAAATYFPSAHVGFHVELSYVGFPVDGGCTGVFFNPDSEHKNEQTCADIQQRGPDGGSIAILTGVTLRAASRRSVSPYGRLNLGIVNQSRSTIAMDGGFVTAGGIGVRQVIGDPKPQRTVATFGAALGFTRQISPGYQFRWEVRDIAVPMKRLTGPANPLGAGPTASRLYHHFSLILGLDVVLEKKRGRRY